MRDAIRTNWGQILYPENTSRMTKAWSPENFEVGYITRCSPEQCFLSIPIWSELCMLFYSEKVGVAYGQDQFCNTVSFDTTH